MYLLKQEGLRSYHLYLELWIRNYMKRTQSSMNIIKKHLEKHATTTTNIKII